MKFVLDTQHYYQDQLLEADTEIGDDTPYPIYDGFAPSTGMTPLDDEATNFSKEWGEKKLNWNRPDPSLAITAAERAAALPGDHHAIVNPSTINRQAQPIIPPPMEHLTHPTDMRPGETQRQNPLVEEALRKENERIAAENDKRMAEQSNREADARSKANLPRGVTVENSGAKVKASSQTIPGQGPAPKTSTQSGVPGQGPAAKPTPPSSQVPRNTSGVVPESDDGKFKEPEKK